MTETATACALCTLAASGGPDQGWVARNDLVSAYANGSNIPGWIQLQVNRHAANLGELSAEESAAVGALSSAIGKAALDITGASKLYAFSMCEFVPHFHLVLGPAPEVPPGVDRGSPLLSRIMVRDDALQDAARAVEVAAQIRTVLA